MTISLQEHYRQKKAYSGVGHIISYDIHLLKIFAQKDEVKTAIPASSFLRSNRKEFRRVIARWVGTYQYIINQILDDIIYRCEELELVLRRSEEVSKIEFSSMFSILTLEYIRAGNHKVAR